MTNKFVSFDMLTPELQTQINSSTQGGAPQWANILNKPQTLGGYGITDAYSKDTLDVTLGDPADLTTTNKQIVAAVNEVYEMIESGGGGGASSNISYLLELSRWGIKNDGTDAVNTSLGINNALDWAATNGYKEVLFPKGTYLISELDPVKPKSYQTINLNGATLRIRDNGLTGYNIILLNENQKYVRITNGNLLGDRDTHDYSSGGSHEGGYGIGFGSFSDTTGNNIRNCVIDNLEISYCTGDSMSFNSSFGQISPIPTALASSWEQGTIDPATGALTASTTKVRSNLNISMTQTRIVQNGYFGLYGNGFGALGSDIVCDYYDVFFYRTDNSYISTAPLVQFFDEVEVPVGANYAKVVLHQSTVPAAANCTINLRVPTFPQYIYVKENNLHHCRRQGISVCGAKNIYIQGNQIHHIGGTTSITGASPMGGIDIEDGYDLNQFIHIDDNNFHDNQRYNLVCVNVKNLFVTNNMFLRINDPAMVSLGINGGCDRVVVANNIIRHGQVTLAGECLFVNNQVYGTQVTLNSVYATRPVSVANSVFYNCKTVIDTPFPYLNTITNCRFINDSDKLNSLSGYNWTIEYKNAPQRFSGCSFEGSDIQFFSYIASNTTKHAWHFDNCYFKGIGIPMIGRVVNCVGENGTLSAYSSNTGTTTDTLELINCRFISTDLNNTLITINNLKSFRMENCYIEKSSGWIMSVQNIAQDVIIKNNVFKVSADTLARDMLAFTSAFTGTQITITNNNLISTNNNQVGINNQTTNGAQVVIKDNVLKKATITFQGTEVLKNNSLDGVIDPYFNVTTDPATLYYAKGQILNHLNPASGGYLGWVCTTSGTANKTAWAATTAYSLNALVNANGKVYKCTVAGTSGSTAPSHSTGTAVDGTVTWQYVNPLAVFKQFGAII